jgi:hypothetical protein
MKTRPLSLPVYRRVCACFSAKVFTCEPLCLARCSFSARIFVVYFCMRMWEVSNPSGKYD